MPDPIKAESRVETEAATETLEDALPQGDAPFKSTEKVTEEPDVESSGEAQGEGDEAAKIAAEITPGSEEKPEEGIEEEASEVDEVLKTPKTEDEKAKVQQRFDKLTAELKTLREELAAAKQGKKSEEVKATPKKYTDEQLASAMVKAVEDRDPGLMLEIMKEQRRNIQDELVEMYNKDKNAASEQAKVIQDEWDETVDAYKDYADTKVPAIYPGSHKDLNLTDGTSLLYQVALKLYTSEDPVKAKYYRGQRGGQKLAVADALAKILAMKAGKGGNSKKLERQLLKEKRKKSVVSGSPGGEEKSPSRPMTPAETLQDVIEERRKYKEERSI